MKLKYFLDMMDYAERLEKSEIQEINYVFYFKNGVEYYTDRGSFNKQDFLEWAYSLTETDSMVDYWQIQVRKNAVDFVIFLSE